MPKLKIKELLNLEPNKHYVLKFHPAFIRREELVGFMKGCAVHNIFIHLLPTEDLSQIKFEEKK